MTTIGGVAEAAVGGIGVIAGIGSANPLLIGGGGVVGLNGIDNAQAGMRQAISGKPVQTATSTAVEAVTGSHLAGEGTNLAIGLVGPGAVAKVATGKGLVASIKSVGSDAWKGIKNAGSSIKNWWKGTPNVQNTFSSKIQKQLYKRGWTEDVVNELTKSPYTIRDALNKANNNPATAFYNQAGDYVVRDNITGEIIQISHYGNKNWIPDVTIRNPYLP